MQCKIIRQSTEEECKNMKNLCLQFVTWGGGSLVVV